jgi:hypothetical protein
MEPTMPLKKEFSDLRQSFEPPHRVISLCSGIRSLWGHSGHGRACWRPNPVANDPTQTLSASGLRNHRWLIFIQQRCLLHWNQLGHRTSQLEWPRAHRLSAVSGMAMAGGDLDDGILRLLETFSLIAVQKTIMIAAWV